MLQLFDILDELCFGNMLLSTLSFLSSLQLCKAKASARHDKCLSVWVSEGSHADNLKSVFQCVADSISFTSLASRLLQLIMFSCVCCHVCCSRRKATRWTTLKNWMKPRRGRMLETISSNKPSEKLPLPSCVLLSCNAFLLRCLVAVGRCHVLSHVC